MTASTSTDLDEFCDAAAEHWEVFRKHVPVGAYLPLGQFDGDCKACATSWPCDPVREVFSELLQTDAGRT